MRMGNARWREGHRAFPLSKEEKKMDLIIVLLL